MEKTLLSRESHFAFGKNLLDYAAKIHDARIAQAMADLRRLCGSETLQGKRGMDYLNDVHDWLGGYPYESISPAGCRGVFSGQALNLKREFVTQGRLLSGMLGSGCDEYAFVRPATADA